MRNDSVFSAPLCMTALAINVLLAPDAAAAIYQFTLDHKTSTANISSNVSSPISGTFKGNYDAVNNPSGTMTRPGLFGGSGNIPINYTGTITGGGDSQSNPAGSYRLDVNTGARSLVMSNLLVDALNGSQPTFPATFNVLYQTFRTFQPDSTFFGGVTLPVPLGELILDSLNITQAADSQPGTLIPAGKNQYQFSVLVDAMIAYTGTFGGNVVGDEYPATILVTGNLTISGNNAVASTAFDWSINQTDAGPFDPFVDLPLDVPTVFPTGSTAHLLVSGTIQSITTQLALNAAMNSNGVRVVPGDINGDFLVNVNDLLAVINSWGACPVPPASCPADIAPPPSGDGVVNVNDLLMVINNWG